MNLNYISAALQIYGLRIFPFIFLAAAITFFLRVKSTPTLMLMLGSIVIAFAPYIFLSIGGTSWFPLHNLVMSIATFLQCVGLLLFAITELKIAA